jgi:hypothetical protein
MPLLVTFYRLLYIRYEAVRCVQVKLLITVVFAGSWIELQQPVIWSLAEYSVLRAWYRLHRLSPSALDSFTWKLNHTETEAQGRHGKLFRGIVFVHNIGRFREHIFFAPRHYAMIQFVETVNVDKVMATAVNVLEQTVWVGKISYF